MTTRKKAEPASKPSAVKVINVSGRSGESVPDDGFFAFDPDCGAFITSDASDKPFKTEEDALKHAKNELEPPFYIAKYTLVARCV